MQGPRFESIVAAATLEDEWAFAHERRHADVAQLFVEVDEDGVRRVFVQQTAHLQERARVEVAAHAHGAMGEPRVAGSIQERRTRTRRQKHCVAARCETRRSVQHPAFATAPTGNRAEEENAQARMSRIGSHRGSLAQDRPTGLHSVGDIARRPFEDIASTPGSRPQQP